MFRRLTLSLLLTICSFTICKFSFATTYVDNGTSNSYTLNASDSLYIASGTYTGNIGGFASGAKITVADIATFQPTGMSYPNVHGTMYIYGTFIMNNATFRTNTDFTIYNYGTVQINNQTRMDGSNQTWVNYWGATMNFVGDVLMNGDFGSNNTVINYETINCSGNFQMNSGSAVTNYKDLIVSGTFRVNGGTFQNEGKLDVTGNILMNNGASVIRNYCRMQATGGITNTSGNFYNYSYVWARNSDIINTATITNIPVYNNPPMIHGRDYTHSGSGLMTGPAYLYFYGTTTMTGGTMGVSTVTTDTIKMYDITRTSPAQIFDVQSGGTRYPNVIYNAWGVPDSTRNYLLGCSIEIILESPLAINWKSFDVILSNDFPLLTWSAEFDRGTIFEIQRSYDGRNFNGIKSIPSEYGRSEYNYSDRLLNTQSTVVYYRIKAIELSGAEKYSPTRMVWLHGKRGYIIRPNPFTNNFFISFQATEKEMITIRLIDVNGQLRLIKNVEVNNGRYDINITGAARLAKGMYMIQVSNACQIISSSKVIKQ